MWFVIIVAVAVVAYVYREKIKTFVQNLTKLMSIGVLLILISTFYITVVTICGWYSRIGDAIGSGIGIIGCLMFLAGMMTS